jgi:aerobic-type carbon monoxide dehydrogenase small subunit (CoxS/CutS family)
MAAVDFLEKHARPTPAEIAAMLSGHLCRCTGYTPIIESIHAFSRSNRRRSDRESSDGEQG